MRFVILKIYSPAVCALIVILQIKIEMIPLNFAHSETLPHLFHHGSCVKCRRFDKINIYRSIIFN